MGSFYALNEWKFISPYLQVLLKRDSRWEENLDLRISLHLPKRHLAMGTAQAPVREDRGCSSQKGAGWKHRPMGSH